MTLMSSEMICRFNYQARQRISAILLANPHAKDGR